ncbi:MAG: response regulator, partial [Rhodothermales bacterium]|nr:response regulator [Rhodothermales bacterium]
AVQLKHILIADDEPHLLRVLRLGLEKAGYIVSAVTNGELALAKFRETSPDVLITDIEMPRMNGEELCRSLEKENSNDNFLVVVVTSHPEESHRAWSSRMPGIKFLEKPLSLRNLCNLLDAHFAASEGDDKDE